MAERKCLCCGKVYDYCPNCSKSSSTPWKINFDTESCKELFNAISAFNMNLINEESVKKVVDKYSIVDYSIYKDDIKELLNKFHSVQKETTNEVVEEIIQGEIPNEESVNNLNEYSEDFPRRGRRNRFFG